MAELRQDPIQREVLIRIVGERGVGLPNLERALLIVIAILIVALAAVMIARMAEPQTLPTVTAPVEGGQPAASTAWRAGAWPTPAVSTQPMYAWSRAPGSTPARSMAAPSATAPSCGAVRPPSAPWNDPIGVRALLRMTISGIELSSESGACERLESARC